MNKRRKTPSGVKQKVPGLGARVQALRLGAGLSQAVLAVRAGITPPRIVDAERLDVATRDTLRRLATALGVSVDDLTGRPCVAGLALTSAQAATVRAGHAALAELEARGWPDGAGASDSEEER